VTVRVGRQGDGYTVEGLGPLRQIMPV